MTTENNQLANIKRDISAAVLAKIEAFKASGELRIPKDYSPENALKSAYLVLMETKTSDGKLVLDYCSKESVANALLKMVVWGLSPLKKQCDFIAYGRELSCDPEYTGNIILAKRYGHLKWINANAIFAGDTFEFGVDSETGRKKIIKHEQTLDSIGSKELKGAYAVFQLEDGTTNVEIMNISQIRSAWNQGGAKGNSPAHKNFPDQMAQKTVINRACKLLIRASDDSVLFSGDEEATDPSEAVKTQNANKKELSIEDAEAEVIENKEEKSSEKTPESSQPKQKPDKGLDKVIAKSLDDAKTFLQDDLGVVIEGVMTDVDVINIAKEHGFELIIEPANGPGF